MIEQATLFDIPPAPPKPVKAKKQLEPKEHTSPFHDRVMALGQACGYAELEVNSSLLIGPGEHFWRAYAVLAVEHRIKEIERAIKRRGL